MTFQKIHNLGSFETESAVWLRYPEGGKEGDFLTISGIVYYWDKYSDRWETGEESTGVTEETEVTESIITEQAGKDDVDPQNIGIHLLGAFDNVGDVWERYPEGGKEGDYVQILKDDGGAVENYYWNKYTALWDNKYSEGDKTSGIHGSDVLAPFLQINNLGSFATINAVWDVYPEGGKEGDYLSAGGKIWWWNKYTGKWTDTAVSTEADLPISETDAKDVQTVLQELVYLGEFKSESEVWEKYPAGGKEGEYLTIGGVKYYWNPYNNAWQSGNTAGKANGKKLYELDGDTVVGGYATVKGDAHINGGAYIKGSIATDGDVTAAGDVTAKGGISASGNITTSGDIAAQNGTFTGNVRVDGEATLPNASLPQYDKKIEDTTAELKKLITAAQTSGDAQLAVKLEEVMAAVSKQYLSKTTPDSASGVITFLKGLLLGDGTHGIDKDGNITSSSIHNDGEFEFGGDIKEKNATKGASEFDGKGFIYNQAKKQLEIDSLIVRMKAVFAELEIRKMSYIGGNYVFSSGGGKIYYVEWLDANGEILEQTEANKSLIDTFRCYLYSDDGTTQTMNWFRVDDQVRCQNFGDLTESKTVKTANGVITDADHTTHYWWRRVNATGKGVIAAKGDNKEYEYIDFQNTVGQYGADSDFPEIGDAMVQLGNWVNEDRQAAIMIVTVGDIAPAIIEWQKIGAGGKHFVMPDEAYSRLSPRPGVGNILRGKFISITDSNKDKSIDEQLNVLLDQLTDIKKQADKKFDIWFNSGAPRPNSATDTATSLPSSDWATDAEKALHVQDLYYDTDKSPASQGGRAWRWMSHNVDNSTKYYWEEVTDQDTIDALERNAALQKQIDNNTLRVRLANLGEVVYELSHEELKTKEDGSGIKIYLNTEAEPATTILNKGDFVYYDASAKKYDGNTFNKLTDNVQTQAFTLAAEIIDSEVITCYNAVPPDATKNAMYDLLLVVASFDDGMGNKYDGKLSISMWNGEKWEALRNGSTAIMENLGNAIVNAVFSVNEDGTTGSAGFVSKKGLSKLFAKSGSSEASVDAFLSFDKDGTPKATTKIKGDNIILEGAVTANKDFYIDTWGNVMTGVDVIFSSEALGDNTFIVENKSNILVQKTCTIVLPNDREYIGRRIMLITEKPATNVGGVGSNLDDFPTIKICTGRVCVNRIYAYDASASGSAGTYRVLYDPSDSDSTKTPWAGVRYLSGLPTMLLSGNYYYPQGVSVMNGYIELLGVGVDANNLYETKDSDKLTAIGYNVDSTSELLAHTLNLGRDTEDKTIIQSAANKGTITTDATTGSASEWQSVGKICRWVVINVRGQLVREYSDFDLSIGVDI